MKFVCIYGMHITSPAPYVTSSRRTYLPVRWRKSDTGLRVKTSISPLKSGVVEWLDLNCKGRWFFTWNRHLTSEDELVIDDEDWLEWQIDLKHGKPSEADRRKFRAFPEIAFENPDDAIIFKLTYGGMQS